MTTASEAAANAPLTADFWEHRYQQGTPRWDLGQPAPPFETWLTSQTPDPGRTIVLGCGRGHEARLFARHGFEVVGVDYAPSAIAAARATAEARGISAQWIQRDIFDLLPDYAQQFDYVVEHTCFCALDPVLRDRYVDLASDLLKPDGTFVGLFFTHTRPGGPPYGSTPGEIRQRFSRRFHIASLSPPANSIPARHNEEHLGIFHRR